MVSASGVSCIYITVFGLSFKIKIPFECSETPKLCGIGCVSVVECASGKTALGGKFSRRQSMMQTAHTGAWELTVRVLKNATPKASRSFAETPVRVIFINIPLFALLK